MILEEDNDLYKRMKSTRNGKYLGKFIRILFII